MSLQEKKRHKDWCTEEMAIGDRGKVGCLYNPIQRPQKLGWGKERSFPRAFRESMSCWCLDFRLLASRALRIYIPVVLSHLVCSTFFFFFYNSNRKLIQFLRTRSRELGDEALKWSLSFVFMIGKRGQYELPNRKRHCHFLGAAIGWSMLDFFLWAHRSFKWWYKRVAARKGKLPFVLWAQAKAFCLEYNAVTIGKTDGLQTFINRGCYAN